MALEMNNTYELFCSITARNPSAPALTYLPSGALDAEPVKINREELLANIRRVANTFHGLGVRDNDVVSFLLPNLLEAQYTLWGAQVAGIVNPINFLLGTDQIIEICHTARTKVLVVLGPHPALDIWQKVEVLKDHVDTLANILIVGEAPVQNEVCLTFQQTVDSFPKDHLLFDRTIAESDIASLFHTGGTTSTPKLALHTHGNEVAAARSTAQMYEFKESDVLVNGLPLFHVAAPILLTLAPLSAGAEVLIPSPAGLRNPEVLENHWYLLQRHGVTIAGGVPTSLSDLTSVPLDDADISSVEFAITGGAPLTTNTAKHFQQHTGLSVHQIYGMTETSGVIAVTPRGSVPVENSVGLPTPGVKIKAVHLDQNGKWLADCKPGEAGVLTVKGKNVFPGYLDSTLAENPFLNNGWLNTGDIGYVDNNGWIFITGRAKDVIIRSGHNIDPAMIEEVANNHPAVSNSVAVGQPDLRAGEVPVVFVTISPNEEADPMEIRQYIETNIPERPANPAAVYIIPGFPLTAVGKIYRPQLRCEAVKHLIERKLVDVITQGNEITVSVTNSTSGSITAILTFQQGDLVDQAVVQTIEERLSGYGFSYTLENTNLKPGEVEYES